MKDIASETLHAQFADCWERGMTYGDLQQTFGMSVGAINQLRLALALPPRAKTAKPHKDVPVSPKQLRAPAMPPHPFWTPERDLAVMTTKGAYRDVEALAEMLGKPKEAVMQRWHKLRSA